MQDKSLIYLCFLNIRQLLCPKNAFSLIYIGIKNIKENKVMNEKMLKFVKVNQQTPKKREVEKRVDDFNEIYNEFINEKAKEQSSRCSQCGVPFCQIHCPLHNNIPDWLKLAAEGRLKEANELTHSTNNMPEVCGRICPQDRLCEGNCVIEQSGHGTVTIGSVEKYITENAWEKGWIEPIKITNEKNQSVGIIGAGPAGLSCAEELRKICGGEKNKSFKKEWNKIFSKYRNW